VHHAVLVEDKESLKNAFADLLDLEACQIFLSRLLPKFTVHVFQNNGGRVGWGQDLVDHGAKERRLMLVAP
jgi:hypothetical protein